MESTHLVNIIVHVVTGALALLCGLSALISQKGGKWHINSGRIFLILMSLVIVTGLIGVFVFRVNTFLLVITLLSGYQGYSGYRVLQIKSNQPFLVDISMAAVTLLSCFYFLYYFKSIGMIWSPVIIYSTVGYLITLIAYDFLRYLIPRSKYKKMWLYEHIVKMIGAFSALLSAFSGTVFSDYQPLSQFLPSTICVVLMIGFVSVSYRKQKKNI